MGVLQKQRYRISLLAPCIAGALLTGEGLTVKDPLDYRGGDLVGGAHSNKKNKHLAT